MKKNRIAQLSFIVVCMMLLALPGGAPALATAPSLDQPPIAVMAMEPGLISWYPQVENGGLVFTVSGPGGFYLQEEHPSGAMPTFAPKDGAGNALPDGSYTYELRLLPAWAEPPAVYDEAQRGLAPAKGAGEPLVQSGGFSILGGGFVMQDVLEDAAGEKGTEMVSPEDQVILDDLIVQGSLCVGMDCVNGESFGFDTQILKENNLRIFFRDTSNSASFPTTDWRIIINDSANGGASYFAIQDSDYGSRVFTLEATAPTNSLYVDDYGRVGLGTSTPVLELHIADGNTPSVRLDQDGSGGWAPQVWDVAGNEANFFIRDATNGSKLPFRIQPSTPGDTLCLKADGKVGIGTWSPEGTMEIETTGTPALFIAERTDGATVQFSAGASETFFGSRSNHKMHLIVNRLEKLTIDTDGEVGIGTTNPTYDLHLVGTGWASVGFVDGSSRETKENIVVLSADEALRAFEGMTPVRYNYKVDAAEERVGFIAEDVPELVATGDRKGLSSMDIVAVLTRVVQQQQGTIRQLEAQNTELEAQNTQMDARLAALEELVATLLYK